MRKHFGFLLLEFLILTYLTVLVLLFSYDFSSKTVKYRWPSDFNFEVVDNCLTSPTPANCNTQQQKAITTWLIIEAFIYCLQIIRRISVLIVWKFANDP